MNDQTNHPALDWALAASLARYTARNPESARAAPPFPGVGVAALH